jgi:hypothetical protein
LATGWKGLPKTNTLAYFQKFITYGRKKFYNIGPVGNVIKLFSAESFHDKLEHLSLESLSSLV